MKSDVLKSELAGLWYVDNPEQLTREIDTYLNAVDPEPREDLAALILPHAGYRYSGMTAAHGIKLLKGRRYQRVIVLGPSHRVPLLDRVSIPDVSRVETPLGSIPVDRTAAAQLWESEVIESHPYAHSSEHSVQIELPFLQRVLDGFSLLPIVCGQLTGQSAAAVGRALLPLLDEQTLVVISTDFTHYGRSFDYVPFTENVSENIRSLDMGAFELIQQKNAEAFLKYIRNTGATICGASPLAVLLTMLDENASIELLKYENSGSLTDDWSHCVSYVAAAVTGGWKQPAAAGAKETAALSPSDRQFLLQLARHRIAERLKKRLPALARPVSAALDQQMGAFVTLRKHGRLRGCIGEIFPRRPLVEAVSEQAVNAAFHDPRFPKLREDELLDIKIEISALTAPQKVGSYEDIKIGRHGMVLSRDMRSAVFLPQVAVEQGWDRDTTLAQLCLKAGLPEDAWRSGCEFHVFEAVVFSEH